MYGELLVEVYLARVATAVENGVLSLAFLAGIVGLGDSGGQGAECQYDHSKDEHP